MTRLNDWSGRKTDSFYYDFYYQIWRPDIVLYNNVGDKIEVNTLIQVYYFVADIYIICQFGAYFRFGTMVM